MATKIIMRDERPGTEKKSGERTTTRYETLNNKGRSYRYIMSTHTMVHQ